MFHRFRFARAAATGVLVLTVPVLSSCGFNFATDQVYTPAVGANDRDSRVDVLNAIIVATEDGAGTLVGTLVNNDISGPGNDFADADHQLTAVGGEVEAGSFQPVTIPAGDFVKLAEDADIKVTGDFEHGDFVEVELTFDKADPVTIEVPVVENNGYHEGLDGDELTPTDDEESSH